MAELRTRKPTGRVAFPLVLVEGAPKAGKSVTALELSASEKVGRTFVLDLGEGTADEYASLGPFEIVEHNGTWSDFYGQLCAACAEPSDPQKPNVVVIDSVTHVWALLVAWTDLRARNSSNGRKKLERDPDAEIDPTMNLWNDSKDRWRQMMNRLILFPGIAVVTARGGLVTKVEGGQPVAGQTVYRVEAEKTLEFDATAQVRMTAGHQATLVAARSLRVDVPAKGLDLGVGHGVLDRLIFDVLASSDGFVVADRTNPDAVGVPAKEAKVRLVEAVRQWAHVDEDADKVKARAAELWDAAGLTGQDEVTQADLDLVVAMAAPAQMRSEAAEPPAVPDTAPEPSEALTGDPGPVSDETPASKAEQNDGLRFQITAAFATLPEDERDDALAAFFAEWDRGPFDLAVGKLGKALAWAEDYVKAVSGVDVPA